MRKTIQDEACLKVEGFREMRCPERSRRGDAIHAAY